MPHVQLSKEDIEKMFPKLLAPEEEPLHDLVDDSGDCVYLHGMEIAAKVQEELQEHGRRRYGPAVGEGGEGAHKKSKGSQEEPRKPHRPANLGEGGEGAQKSKKPRRPATRARLSVSPNAATISTIGRRRSAKRMHPESAIGILNRPDDDGHHSSSQSTERGDGLSCSVINSCQECLQCSDMSVMSIYACRCQQCLDVSVMSMYASTVLCDEPERLQLNASIVPTERQSGLERVHLYVHRLKPSFQ